ncbi:VOC family protein [Pseudonocardia nantongensis]|uniref:VOC family protein n=1 Tax=Pseudonocardia nantongensis TaxID=1181885 RepID=UPI003978C75E
MKTITPCLWFDGLAEEAAQHYTSIFPDSGIDDVSHYGPEWPEKQGQILTVSFRINGQPYTALNGGPEFTFSEAVSMEVHCESAEEVDRIYDALVDGGSPQPCGWLKGPLRRVLADHPAGPAGVAGLGRRRGPAAGREAPVRHPRQAGHSCVAGRLRGVTRG